MARRVQAVSPNTREGGSGLQERWWRTPTVMAAIIAAVAAITVAVIQLSGPKSKASGPITIEQETSGSGSPTVGHTGGNVTIQQQPTERKP